MFDSGVGGLSVLRALQATLPGQAFIYLADSGHAPYGDRSAAFIESRAVAAADFLVQRGARALVLACNTASVVAARRLRALHTLPIVAMEPAIKPAALHTRTGVVLVLATTATVGSPAVARLCEAHAGGARILLQACPGLVELAEQGRFDDDATRALLRKYMAPALAEGADTVVLGCTHYALLADAIAAVAGPGITVLEPSAAIARQLQRRLGVMAAAPWREGRDPGDDGAVDDSAGEDGAGGLGAGRVGAGHVGGSGGPGGFAGGNAEFYTSGSPAGLTAFLTMLGRTDAPVHAWPGGMV